MNTKHMIAIQRLLVPKRCKLIAILLPATKKDAMMIKAKGNDENENDIMRMNVAHEKGLCQVG